MPGCASGSAGSVEAAVPHKAQRAPFIIGVWAQPSYSFAKWRARGINTVVSFESLSGTVPYSDWRAELERQNLYAIRQPYGAPGQDARDPRLLAWMQDDEPDITDNNTSPGVLQRRYKRWKKAAPRLPAFLNFCGRCVLAPDHSEKRYRSWIAGSDWVSNDFYPLNSGRSAWIDRLLVPVPPMGFVLDRLNSWSRGKRQIEIVETSDQQTSSNGRAPTPAELRGIVWHSIVHGASGIVYFPQQIGGKFMFDTASPRLVAEMKRINKSIARLAPVLLSRGRRTPAPKPFELATRVKGRRVYSILLNLSHRAARYHGRRFRPFEVGVSSRIRQRAG